MQDTNYYRQCALFLAESYGVEIGAKHAAELSREAFHRGDISGHYHWKFVVDYLDGPQGHRVSGLELAEANDDPRAFFAD